jgi:hypothetical protein
MLGRISSKRYSELGRMEDYYNAGILFDFIEGMDTPRGIVPG